MQIVSIGNNEKFISPLQQFKKYRIKEVSSHAEASVVLPAALQHDGYERWAEQNYNVLEAFVDALDQEVTFVMSGSVETGIFLIVLEICKRMRKTVEVILLRKDVGSRTEEKTLNRVLFGILYQFLNKGIATLYLFYFDFMRKFYPDIKIVNDVEFYKKSALLYHKKNVFLKNSCFLELTGRTTWTITDVADILAAPRLVLLTESPIPEQIIQEFNVFLFRAIYYVSEDGDNFDEKYEREIEEVSNVLKEYKFYSLGKDGLIENFVVI
jgi:hypothetical protein